VTTLKKAVKKGRTITRKQVAATIARRLRKLRKRSKLVHRNRKRES
jgi:hypothetical protein